LSDIIYHVFLEEKKADFTKVTVVAVPEDEEDRELFFPEIYVKFVGVFMEVLSGKEGFEAATGYFDSLELKTVLGMVREFVEDDIPSIKDAIKEEFKVSDQVLSLIQ